MERERIIYLDYMRVFAIIAVIILHVAAQNWYVTDVNGLEWNVFNIFEGVTRWGVPVFLMISGTLFLPKEIEMKQICSKYILRLFVSYLVWAFLYATVLPLIKNMLGMQSSLSIKGIIENIIFAKYHMWFIPMIIGIYLSFPIIKQIVAKKEIAKYFLTLSFVFSFLIPQFMNVCKHFLGRSISQWTDLINKVVIEMNMNLVMGYVFYFILGYELSQKDLSAKQRKKIYLLGIIGFVFTIVLTALSSNKMRIAVHSYYDNFNINVLFEAIAVYTFFKYKDYKNTKLNSLICKLSKYSFGAYLTHIFIMEILEIAGLNTLSFSPILSVPIISILVIIISFLVSGVLNKVPDMNKWIV